MKTVLKSLVVGLMVFALSFSPALAGLAKAGVFNFEGISSIKTDDTQSYEKQPRGLMFNFSFGGPKDYKKTKSQIAMMDQTQVLSVVGFAAVMGIIALTITKNKDDTLTTELPPETDMPPEN
ncbi:hypothetical protein ACFLZ5_06160 [Thermodesulfobacteriota bacterium]